MDIRMFCVYAGQKVKKGKLALKCLQCVYYCMDRDQIWNEQYLGHLQVTWCYIFAMT